MATWVVGDIHGCAAELERLLAELELGKGDSLVALGDLFHRGPDPLRVARLLAASGARTVLGNHEHALLARLRSHPPSRELTPADVCGDSGRPLHASPAEAMELVEFLGEHARYFLESRGLPGAGPTPDGRAWCAVHAGLTPGRTARASRVEDLVYPARLGSGSFWYEGYQGPELVLFGHLVQKEPRRIERGGRTVAIGLDTGALYGGRLTAYCPERDEFRSVRAERAHVER